MRAGERLALAIVVGSFVLIGGAAGAATYAWHAAGTVHVSVHEPGPDGIDLDLHVPGLFLDAAIALCPSPQLSDEEGLREGLAVLGAVADQLHEMPDAVIVNVRDAEETVRIAKENGRLTIRVRGPGESIHVDVPLGSVRRIAAKLGRGRSAA